MKKHFFKNEKGINLISLSITVIIILILTGVVLYNLKGNLGIQRLQALQSDIQNIREKVEIYYANYEELPTSVEYTNTAVIDNLGSAGVLGDMDTGSFYLIDLSELENLTLNYGEDYAKIKNGESQNDLLDVYIINANSHNIFYAEGVTVDGEKYYSDNTSDDDISGEYISLQELGTINKVSNARDGERLFKKDTEIVDDYGNKLIIPKGFKIATDSATSVTGGVVIEDASYSGTIGNQYVWIPVGKVYTDTEMTEANAKTITLGRYVFDEDGSVNTSLSKTEPGDQLKISTSATVYYTEGLKNETTENTHAKDIEEFISSANNNGGYYIARYEAGIDVDKDQYAYAECSGTGSSLTYGDSSKKYEKDGSVKPIIKSGVGVWNAVTQPEAAIISQKMYTSINSDLINSYAWDTAIVFIQNFGTKANSANYSRTNGKSTTGEIATTGTNLLNETSLIDEQCNIYDMAGNVKEWTTETSSRATDPCVVRGGAYNVRNYTAFHNIRQQC